MKTVSYMDGSRELIIDNGISIYFDYFRVQLDGEETHLYSNEIPDPICMLTGDQSREFINLNVIFD